MLAAVGARAVLLSTAARHWSRQSSVQQGVLGVRRCWPHCPAEPAHAQNTNNNQYCTYSLRTPPPPMVLGMVLATCEVAAVPRPCRRAALLPQPPSLPATARALELAAAPDTPRCHSACPSPTPRCRSRLARGAALAVCCGGQHNRHAEYNQHPINHSRPHPSPNSLNHNLRVKNAHGAVRVHYGHQVSPTATPLHSHSPSGGHHRRVTHDAATCCPTVLSQHQATSCPNSH